MIGGRGTDGFLSSGQLQYGQEDERLVVVGATTVTVDLTGGIFAPGGELHNQCLWRGHIDFQPTGGVPEAASLRRRRPEEAGNTSTT